MYPDELPQVGEVVMVRVTEANLEVGATCELLEYNHIGGLVIATELSRKRIRSVKQVIGLGKEEAVVVLRVDRSGIDLSKRRLEEGDSPKAKTRFAKSKIVHSIFNRVGVVLGIPLIELYESFGWAMYRRDEDDDDDTRHPLDDFHLAMHDPALVFGKFQAQIQALNAKYQLTAGSGVLELLMACIGHRLQLKPVRVQAELEATCFSKQGVSALHHAFLPFREAPKQKKDKKQTVPATVAEELADELLVRVCTKASPIYAVYAVSHDKTKALAAVKNVLETVQARLRQHGGQALMNKEPKISI
jgi:translation initiation factor 2 subunit 1